MTNKLHNVIAIVVGLVGALFATAAAVALQQPETHLIPEASVILTACIAAGVIVAGAAPLSIRGE